MEELLGLLIGAGAVALAPLVPALRPVAKMAVKGGLIAVEATAMAAAVVGQRLHQATERRGDAARSEAYAVEAVPIVIEANDPGGAVFEIAPDLPAVGAS